MVLIFKRIRGFGSSDNGHKKSRTMAAFDLTKSAMNQPGSDYSVLT
jgi:hypothetical protein